MKSSDAVRVVPDECDPVAVFEFDRRFHDQPENAGGDDLKHALETQISALAHSVDICLEYLPGFCTER